MKQRLYILISLIVVFSMVLVACGPVETNTVNEEDTVGEENESGEAETDAEAEEVETTEEETAEEAAEETVEEAEMPSEPMELILAITDEPDTLDPHRTGKSVSDEILTNIGGSLVHLNSRGEIVPFLAESWDISEDGLTYTFHLREDVKFHNGSPLTAQDWAYTYSRAVDPEIASPAAGTMLASAESFEAVDDYTFVIHLAEPFYPLLITLAIPGFLQPLSQAYVEEVGEDVIARNPVGVGPYKFVEWQTGDRIVLEVNSDFVWGPEEEGSGPYLIDTIEYRIIPEEATIVAGLEAGEIHCAQIEVDDVELFESLPFDILEIPHSGMAPFIAFNVTAAPLDDINVRKALNMAIDREVILEVLYKGKGVIQYGPLSPSVIGYWEEVEEYGYAYDPEGARSLLEESGYSLNEDGKFEKDGQVLSIILNSGTGTASIKLAEVSQAMFQEIGIEVKIEQMEESSLVPKVFSGDYQMSVFGYGYPEADIMYLLWHSDQIGALNYFFVDNPELDALIELTRTATDAAERQQAVNDAQKMITEEAYFIASVAPSAHLVVSQNVKDYGFSPLLGIWFNKAYIE